MHIVIIDTDDGTDVYTYCSDSCARTNPAYAGWYGAQEAAMGDICEACGVELYDEDDADAAAPRW